MSGMSQTMNSPPRRREGPWSYSYEYGENSPHYGHHAGAGAGRPGGYYGAAPGMYGGPPPPPGPPASHQHLPPPPPTHSHAPPQGHPGDYWSYDHPASRNTGGYWGPPPAYDSYNYPPGADRRMPPPARGPRGPPRHGGGPEEHLQSPGQSHLRIPPSPRMRHGRGADPSRKRGDFLPPPPNKDGNPKKKGDPLSILANVSAGMTGKDGQKKQPQQPPQHNVPLPAPTPTSPLQRRTRPSPITPNTNSPSQRQIISPGGANRSIDRHPSWDYGPESGYMEPPPPQGYYSTRRRHPGHSEYSPRPAAAADGSPPALVERGSFDSQGDPQYRDRAPPSYYYDDHGYGYWDGAPPAYPPPRYNHYDWYEGAEDPYAHHRQAPPMAPYTLVQQPRLEEKTILRKKFSWKHYPEVSTRFFSLQKLCLSYDMHSHHLLFPYTVGTILDCKPRRIPQALEHELHCRTEAVQQLADRTPTRSCCTTQLHV